MAASIGIRREDDPNERRAPLNPEQVGRLVAEYGLEVRVDRAPQRVFEAAAYEAAGASMVDGLEGCNLILGVKEVPIPAIVPGTAHAFFSLSR